MTKPEHAAQPQPVTAEYITEQTGHILRGTYEPDIFKYPWGLQALRQHVATLQRSHGDDNVMTSFYENVDGQPRVGVFAKPSHSPKHARREPEWTGALASRETMEMPPVELGDAPPD